MIKLCKYLSTMWNRTDSRFVAGLNNIADRFLCKADFILSKKIPHDTSLFYTAGSYTDNDLN